MNDLLSDFHFSFPYNRLVFLPCAVVSLRQLIMKLFQGNKGGRPQSILSDLTFQSLKDCHHLHILNSSATGM